MGEQNTTEGNGLPPLQCCSPEIDGGGGWGVFNSLFGWQNSATYGSVISYNLYWIVVIFGFLILRFKERNGHWPFIKSKSADKIGSDRLNEGAKDIEKQAATPSEEENSNKRTTTAIQEIQSNSS